VVDAPVTPELAELEGRPTRRQRPLLGYAMVVSAASLWAVSGVVIKVILQSGLSSYRLAELRSAGGAVLFLGAVVVTRPQALRFERRELPWLAAFGVLGLAFVQFFYFVGIERIEIGVALVIQYLAPVWVVLWARFFVREPVRRRLWYALALSLAGLSLMVELWSGFSLDGVGVAACIVGSLAYAIYILMAERSLARGRNVLSLLAWGFLFATLFWTVAQPWWSFPGGVLDDDVSLLGRISETSLPVWLLAPACSLDRLTLGVRQDPPCAEGTEPASAATPSGRERWCRRRADGMRHGPYLAWHANGRTQAEGAFADGREHGRWTRWYANGRRLLEGEYRDGVKQGRWTFWYANGVEKEAGEFRDGREHGRWTRWFENGQKLSEGDYRDGVREGRWTFWYESGLTRETGEYRNGERRGEWRRFSVNGRPCDDTAA